MATIKELTYLVWDILDGREPTDDSRFTKREIRELVLGGIADALKRDYYEQRNAEPDIVYANSNYTATYKNLPIQTDAASGLQYVEIPSKSISIPGGRDIDITEANQVSVWAKQYIPVRREEVFVGGLQPSIPCVILYYKEDGKVWFYNNPVSDSAVNITQYYTLPESDDAEINMPEEMKNYIIQSCLQTLGVQIRPVDHNNDGTEQ